MLFAAASLMHGSGCMLLDFLGQSDTADPLSTKQFVLDFCSVTLRSLLLLLATAEMTWGRLLSSFLAGCPFAARWMMSKVECTSLLCQQTCGDTSKGLCWRFSWMTCA